MSSTKYDALANSLAGNPGSIPVINCPEFVTLLEALFSPEEAELAAQMTHQKQTLAQISENANRPPEEVEPLLESMAVKGLVFHMAYKGEKKYKLMEVVPGFFEFQFMKGESTPRDIALSKLFQDYFDKVHESSKLIPPALKKITPFSRIISVDKEIKSDVVVHPYETISEYIDKSDYIALSYCYCRHHGELKGDACSHPKEVCLAFGPNAKFIIDYKFGRAITKEEAYDVLKTAEKHGLVHISSNTTKYLEYVCNCCVCHCGILQSVINPDMPSMSALSNFELVIDEDACVGCGECVDICPARALSVDNDLVQLDKALCIGCGVCNVACPSSALSMSRKADSKEPPYDMKDLGITMMKSIQDAISSMDKKA